jgi:hypothetical protein
MLRQDVYGLRSSLKRAVLNLSVFRDDYRSSTPYCYVVRARREMIAKKYSNITTVFIAVGFLIGLSALITSIVVGKILLFDEPVDGRYFALKNHRIVEVSVLAWYVSKIQAVAFLSLWLGAVISYLVGYIAYTIDYSRRPK